MATIERPTWDRVARAYDLQAPLERPALRALAEMLAIGGDERLLDLGTGTGQLLRLLADGSPRPRVAIGLDSSGAMLAKAAARPLPPGWRVEHGEAEDPAFADRSFELVTAAFLLHLLDRPTRARVITASRRLLRPGGRLGVITVAPARTRAGAWLAAPLERLAARSTGALAGLRALDPRDELSRGGFEVHECRRVRRGYPSLCVVAESMPNDTGG